MTTFFFIRHGETEANKSGILQGHMDVPLSDIGRRQAEVAREALKDVPLDAVYSSDLSRAYETAEIIAGYHGLEVKKEPGFKEIKCGRFEGKNLQDNAVEFPTEVRALDEDPVNAVRPGGESYKELCQRVEKAFLKAAKDCEGKTVAIVAHGGTLRCLIAIVKGTAVDPKSPSVANCSFTVVEGALYSWTIKAFNKVDHLVDAGFTDVKERAAMYRW